MPTDGERWNAYLYRHYDPDEVARRARSLEFFRFVRYREGPFVDVDRLVVKLELDDEVRRIAARVESIEGGTARVEEWTGYLKMCIDGEPDDPYWRVTESAVESARVIEAELRPLLQARVVDPPVDSERCICPKYYPEIWTARTS